MKNHKNKLDVDFIGGAAPLTKEEEKTISEFIKTSRVKQQQKTSKLKARSANKSIAANVAEG